MTSCFRRRFRPRVDRLDDRCLPAASGLTPAQIATAYGLAGLTFGKSAADGSGQTIAIVDPGDDPNIQAELAGFDARFNLPAPPSLTVVGQSGTASLPRGVNQGSQEEALDVEWAHALAPGARLILVEANSSLTVDLVAAVQTAASLPGVSVVSMSWGGSENFDVTTYDSVFTAPGITFVAASGDTSALGGAQWPATSPYIVGVGGTTLQVDANGNYISETPWGGSTGGMSLIESEPPYQASVQSTGARTSPDVAFDADPNTGVQVYSIDPGTGQASWQTLAGTSLGAPAWAAIVAMADQGRSLAGAGTLSSLQTLNTLYSLPSSDFHVIGGGYNTQTGLGTPNGAPLIHDLMASQASAATTLPGSGSSSSATTPVPIGPTSYPWPVITVITPVGAAPTAAKHHHKQRAHAKPVHQRSVHQANLHLSRPHPAPARP